MKKFNKSKAILLVFCLFLISAVAGVWAFFETEESIANHFYTAKPKVTIEEVFNPEDPWVPGEHKKKEVAIKNDSNIDMVMRFKVVASASNAEGVKINADGVPVNEDNEPLYEIGWNEAYLDENFIKKDTEYKMNTWYYFKNVMEPGDITKHVMESVDFADWADNEYQGMSIYVTVKAEMLQVQEEVTTDSNAAKDMGWYSYTVDSDGNITWSPTS